ncbi:MAG: tripartite tricarboxylate transporter substrate-binding protein [Gammaproteobacteria bacterium]|nr:tripartite tricarboxylate transporter substrate-binding protein [Gammaproteobacteria bacterium]
MIIACRVLQHIAGWMVIRKLSIIVAASLALMASVAPRPALAEYPEEPVRFIVPWPPGNLEDALTRLIAEQMQSETGTAAAVINKPGGGNGPYPGAAQVGRAKPDGYTIGSLVSGVPTVGALVGIDGIKRDTFEPIGIFLTYPLVLAAGSNARYANMAELASYARRHNVVLGHFGYESVATRASVIAGMELGFEFGGDAYFDRLDCNTLASGDVDVIITTLQEIRPCLDTVKVLASITEKRIEMLPGAATLGEQVKGIDLTLWNGLFVPKGTPSGVKKKIAAIARKAIMGAKAQKIGKDSGALVYWQEAGEAQARVDTDYRKVKDMLRRMGDL